MKRIKKILKVLKIYLNWKGKKNILVKIKLKIQNKYKELKFKNILAEINRLNAEIANKVAIDKEQKNIFRVYNVFY